MTSIMEPLDENMLDYPADADISMYAGTSASFWISQEAAMDDDSNTITLDSTSDHSETIEVDMEPHDHDEEMYEMADEDGVHRVEELRDVEVPDSSPPFSVTMPTADTILTQSMTSEQTSLPSLPASSLPVVEGLVLEIHEQPAAVHSPMFAEIPSHDLPPAVQERFAQHAVEATSPQTAATQVTDENREADISATSFTVPDTESLVVTSGHVELAEPETDVVASAAPLAVDASDASENLAAAAEVYTGPHVEEAERAAASDPAAEPSAPTEAYHDSYEELEENPLEISDGVYIDPPPAVLLIVTSGTEESECCLFNYPISDSYAQGSSTEQSADENHLALLLHDQPTLYYESLSKVFAALREDASLQEFPSFAEGELVLDAYDLQLVISEDNIHAPDVTIHELNVLHDASGLQGPLQMKLYALTPRFISRYYTLRDQLLRLDIGTEEVHADYHEEQHASEHDENPEESHETHLPEGDTSAEAAEGEHGEAESEYNVVQEERRDLEPQPTDENAEHSYGEVQEVSEQTTGVHEDQFPADNASRPDDESHQEEGADQVDEITHSEEARTEQEPKEEHAQGSSVIDPHLPAEDAVADLESAHWDGYAEDNATAHEVPEDAQEQVSEQDIYNEQAEDENSLETHVDDQPDAAPQYEDDSNVKSLEEATYVEVYGEDTEQDAEGEYEEDTSEYANEDDTLQYSEEGQDDDDLYYNAPPQSNGAVHDEKPEATSAHEALQDLSEHDETTTTEEDDQQELLDFEDDFDTAQQPQSDKLGSPSRGGVDSSSGTSSKRTFDQLELEEEETFPPSSPNQKRLRAV